MGIGLLQVTQTLTLETWLTWALTFFIFFYLAKINQNINNNITKHFNITVNTAEHHYGMMVPGRGEHWKRLPSRPPYCWTHWSSMVGSEATWMAPWDLWCFFLSAFLFSSPTSITTSTFFVLTVQSAEGDLQANHPIGIQLYQDHV